MTRSPSSAPKSRTVYDLWITLSSSGDDHPACPQVSAASGNGLCDRRITPFRHNPPEQGEGWVINNPQDLLLLLSFLSN